LLHFPNAKINIGLFVSEKRSDGYHNIETVFYPIRQLKDALEIIPAEETSIRISGKSISGDLYDNLVWKAYLLIKSHFPEQMSPIAIHLIKAIPMGAGLGGGSADAAFMLRLLNQYFNLGLSDPQLAQFALDLGSDCPFFIYNTPQIGKSRGEILSPIDLNLSNYSIQVICPKLHIATKDAFSKIKPQKAPFDLTELPNMAIEEWKNYIFNDFESPVFEIYPQLADIKETLYKSGALYASMSGSGSTLYGIFEQGKQSALTSNEEQEVYYFE
jgi:4-diphosphocytidyl-2-C-methyl-D-erythritol kinase